MTTAAAIGLAVVGAVCFAVAAYLQHDAVHRNALAGAVRRPAWLAGLALIGVGATLHAVALALAPLVVVQPIGVLALPLVAVLHVRAAGARLGTPALAAIGATGIGVALFVTVAATVTVPGTPPMSGYARAGWFAGFAVIALAGVAVATTGRRRCLAYAAGAGVAYALVSILIRAIGQPLAAGRWELPLAAPLGIVAALAVGGVLVQLGYASGPPAVVVACLTIVDPLVSVAVGIGLLGETSPSATGWTLLAGTASALVAVAGTVALARHHPEVAARSAATSPAPVSRPPAGSRPAGGVGPGSAEPGPAGAVESRPAGAVEPRPARAAESRSSGGVEPRLVRAVEPRPARAVHSRPTGVASPSTEMPCS